MQIRQESWRSNVLEERSSNLGWDIRVLMVFPQPLQERDGIFFDGRRSFTSKLYSHYLLFSSQSIQRYAADTIYLNILKSN